MTTASSSHAELETAFRSLYACNSKELRDLSMRSVDLASTRHLTALQGQTTDLMAQRVSEVSAQVESILSQRHAELHRVTQLTTSLESQKTHLEEESARITATIETLRGDATKRRALLKSSTSAAAAQLVVESNRSQGDATTGGAATKDASLVRSQRAELVSDLRYYTWLLRNLADLSDEELQTADLGDAACVLEGWTDTVPDVERRIDAIERNATGSSRPSLSVDSTCWSSEELRTQWEAVRRARSVQEARLLTECTRRHEKNQNVHGFLLEQAKMLQWCREQTTQLENLQQADHVQEFCASLQNNNATMDANFLVLGEMAEALLPHAAVQKGITDVSRAWFQLQVYTYERLRQCLLDQHMDAKLEDTLRAWSNYFYPVKEYFHTVEGLLLQPTEDEAVAFLTPLLESVRTLQNESVPHQLIVDHLADFSLRMQCIQENYNALRPSIFSSLSVLYPALAVHTSVQHAAWGRRAEYNQKVSDLADWMDVNGQAEIWEGLSQRIDRVRSAVEEERTETA